MIDISRFEKYISSISYDLDEDLDKIYNEAILNHVPVIRRASIDLLRTILTIIKPNNILELGTAVGFSASLMSRIMDNQVSITTIERNDNRIAKAKENFKLLKLEDNINLVEGDALEVIDNINETFDFIFLDSAKSSYKELLPKLISRLNKGGVLVTDNILQEGKLLSPRSIISQRDRTTYDRMREFVYDLYHTNELVTTVIPSGDGMAISVKNN